MSEPNATPPPVVESSDEEARLAQVLLDAVFGDEFEPRLDALWMWEDVAKAVLAAGYLPPAQVAERERSAAERALTEAADALREHDDLGSTVAHAAFQVAYSLLLDRAALAAAHPEGES